MGVPVVFITEPLLDVAFTQYRAVIPVAARLAPEFEVTIVAPVLAPSVADELARLGLGSLSGGARFPPLRNARDEVPSFVYSWTRDALLSLNRRLTSRLLAGDPRFRVNISMTNSVPCDIWYAMSRPLGDSLASIQPNLSPAFRLATGLAKGAVDLVAERHLASTGRNARQIVTSTDYVAGLYRRRGLFVSGSIPVFLYPPTFRPTSAAPRRDYILAYLGKETDMKAINDLIRLGYPVTLFGGKSAQLVQSHLGRTSAPNLSVLGAVSHERLLDLYTHALFTAFPFTDESFGLVPVESMACGTPVLTYCAQGPGETVLDGETGWLASDETDFIGRAGDLIAHGYPPRMSLASEKRADQYQLPRVAEMWKATLRSGIAMGHPR